MYRQQYICYNFLQVIGVVLLHYVLTKPDKKVDIPQPNKHVTTGLQTKLKTIQMWLPYAPNSDKKLSSCFTLESYLRMEYKMNSLGSLNCAKLYIFHMTHIA